LTCVNVYTVNRNIYTCVTILPYFNSVHTAWHISPAEWLLSHTAPGHLIFSDACRKDDVIPDSADCQITFSDSTVYEREFERNPEPLILFTENTSLKLRYTRCGWLKYDICTKFNEKKLLFATDRYSDKAAGWTTRIQFLCGGWEFFSSPPRPDRLWGPRNWGFFLRGYSGRVLKLTTHLHVSPRSRMCGDIPPLPTTSSWRGA